MNAGSALDQKHSPLPRILVAVDLSKCLDALEPLRKVGQVQHLSDFDQQLVESLIHDVHAYLGHTDVLVNEEFLSKAKQLQVVCTCSTGRDHIDLDALKARDIPLISLTTAYELLDTFTSTAEMAWLLLLASRRRLPRLMAWAKDGNIGLEPGQPLPNQLSRQTLGIVGYGRLGKMVAEYGKAFRMRVITCDPYKEVDSPGIEQVDFETLLRDADVISLHVHLNDETRYMIDRDVLARTKPGVTLINVSRGGLVCEEALLEAVQSGHVFAAGLDVVDNEWDANLYRRPLLEYARTHDNLILTPHVGGGSIESMVDARRFIARKLAEFLSNKELDG
jgi:D-3-phosphoglycerate dehydrogenase